MVLTSATGMRKKLHISHKSSNSGIWNGMKQSFEISPLYRERELGKRVFNLEIQDLFTKITKKKRKQQKALLLDILYAAKKLWLKIIKCICMFYRLFLIHNSVCFSYQDVQRRDDWQSCFKIMKLPSFPWPPLFKIKDFSRETKNSIFSKKIHENHLFQSRPISAVLSQLRLVEKRQNRKVTHTELHFQSR